MTRAHYTPQIRQGLEFSIPREHTLEVYSVAEYEDGRWQCVNIGRRALDRPEAPIKLRSYSDSDPRESFSPGTIQRGHLAWLEQMDDKDTARQVYCGLPAGVIVHMNIGHDRFVSAEIVEKDLHTYETALRPIALVGAWAKHELPHRTRDGHVHIGTYASYVLHRKELNPPVDDLYETPLYRLADRNEREGVDPRGMWPLDLNVPPFDEHEQRRLERWAQVKQIEQTIKQGQDPEQVLHDVKRQLNELGI